MNLEAVAFAFAFRKAYLTWTKKHRGRSIQIEPDGKGGMRLSRDVRARFQAELTELAYVVAADLDIIDTIACQAVAAYAIMTTDVDDTEGNVYPLGLE